MWARAQGPAPQGGPHESKRYHCQAVRAPSRLNEARRPRQENEALYRPYKGQIGSPHHTRGCPHGAPGQRRSPVPPPTWSEGPPPCQRPPPCQEGPPPGQRGPHLIREGPPHIVVLRAPHSLKTALDISLASTFPKIGHS